MVKLNIDNLRSQINNLLSVESKLLDRAFAVFLLAFVLYIIVEGFTYSPQARFFPFVIAVPTMLMLTVLFVMQTSQYLSSVVENRTGGSLFSVEAFRGGSEVGDTPNLSRAALRGNALQILFWIGILVMAITVLGHVVGLFVSLIGIYRYYGEQVWIRAIIYSFVNVAFLVGLFLFAFNTRLYGGLVFG